jgi:hypothetical protein
MAIGDPILAFTLSRLAEKSAAEPSLAPPRDSERDLRPQAGTADEETGAAAEFEEGPPQANFDYAAASAENVAEITMLVSRIKASRKRHVEAVHDVGLDLLRAKELLGHGNFLPWLQAEFRWSERTANNYMSIARFFRGKTANFADLDIGAAAALAAKSTPSEIRIEMLERAEAGESISRKEVKERIAAGKKARKSAQAAAAQAEPTDAASIGRSEEGFAQPCAIVGRTNPDEFTWAAQALRSICSDSPPATAQTAVAMRDPAARRIIEAMLEIEGPIERLCSGAPEEVANMLLAAANERELLRVQRTIAFVLQIKQALDDGDGFREGLRSVR